jgi:hypothetical protein
MCNNMYKYQTRLTLVSEPELWITKCCSKLIYETLPGKEVVCVLPITSKLGRLQWFGLEILELYCSAIVMAAPTELIASRQS